MPDAPTRAPSARGCAIGFGWAGMGVGALLWLRFCPPFAGAADDREAVRRHLELLYGGSFVAMGVGTLAGAGLGVLYARRRLRPHRLPTR